MTAELRTGGIQHGWYTAEPWGPGQSFRDRLKHQPVRAKTHVNSWHWFLGA